MTTKTPNAEFPRLPEIPTLAGEDTFEAWHNALLLQLAYHDVDDIVIGNEQAPAYTTSTEVQKRFKKKQVLAYTMLSNSIQPILTMLQALGLSDNKPKQVLDPRSLYDAIIKWDSEISAEHKFRLVEELTEIDHSQFPSLSAFLDRALWLRRRLQRAFFEVSDELMDMLLLKGISSYDDVWVKMVLHDKNTGCLAENVASLIAKKASEQKVISDASEDTACLETTEEGTQVNQTKAHEEMGTQAETIVPTETCNDASIVKAPHPGISDAAIPSAADDLKTFESSAIATPNKDTTTVDSSSITNRDKENKLPNNRSPQSDIDFGRKSPITNVTTSSPILIAAQAINKGVTKPSNTQPSGPVTNTGNQTGGTPQHISCFGPRPATNYNNGAQNGAQNGLQTVNAANANSAHLANRNKNIHAWLLGNTWVGTDTTAWIDPDAQTQRQQSTPSQQPASVKQSPSAAQQTLRNNNNTWDIVEKSPIPTRSISPESSISVKDLPSSEQQPSAPPPLRKPKPHDIPDFVKDLDPKARAQWFRDFGPHTFASYWREKEEEAYLADLAAGRKPNLRITKRRLGPEDPRYW